MRDARAAVVRDNSTPTYKVNPGDIPADAVTSSGSGLDPHISPAYAKLQVHRVAAKNGLDVREVEDLVADHTAGRVLGFLGNPGERAGAEHGAQEPDPEPMNPEP